MAWGVPWISSKNKMVSSEFILSPATADLVGDVHNLKKLKDIEGTYTAAQASVAIAAGGKFWTLKNKHGVVLKMSGKQVGIEVALDIGGMNLKLK